MVYLNHRIIKGGLTDILTGVKIPLLMNKSVIRDKIML